MAKLTEAQFAALQMMPVQITMWGGKPFSGMPMGIRSTATLHALSDRGFATLRVAGLKFEWTITPAGRAALAEASK